MSSLEIILLVIIFILFLSIVGSIFLFLHFNKLNNNKNLENEKRNEKTEEAVKNTLEKIQTSFFNFKEENQKEIHNLSSKMINLSNTSDKNQELTKNQIDKLVENIIKISEENKTKSDLNQKIDKMINLFYSQKGKGLFSEKQLSSLLSDFLGSDSNGILQTQRKLDNNLIPDFVINFNSGTKKIVIDSKFVSDNYSKYLDETDQDKKQGLWKMFANDIKKIMEDVEKYFDSKENILFILVYIPSDLIFADLVHHNDTFELIGKKANKKVFLVSPTTIFFVISFLYELSNEMLKSKNLASILKEVTKISKKTNDFFSSVNNLAESSKKTLDAANKLKEKTEETFKHLSKFSGKLGEIDFSNYNKLTKDSIQLEQIDEETKNNLLLENKEK